MNNKQIFLIGSIVFFIYLFFYLRIVIRNFGKDNKDESSFVDSNDFDGIGNQGEYQIKNQRTELLRSMALHHK